MQDVTHSSREVVLYGTRFPISGGVRRTVVTPFPPKITIGDYSRDDRIIESSWVVSSFNGGLGIHYGQIPRDQDRFWFGDLETRYRFLSLGPRVVQATTDGADAIAITDYNGSLYVITPSTIYRWTGSALTSEYSIPGDIGVPNSVNQFNQQLWVQCANGIIVYDGDMYRGFSTDNPVPDNPGQVDLPGVAAIVWDDKYFRITDDGTMYYQIVSQIENIGSTDIFSGWTECGRMLLPHGYVGQMMLFFDLTGDLVIHVVTKTGLWAYDFGSRRFYPTALQFPYSKTAGKGAIVWRGEALVPAGPTIYKYNGATVENVGPAKDDGLPFELQGDVVRLIGGHGFYFSMIQAKSSADSEVSADTDNMRSASGFYTDVVAQQPATPGAIICSPGVAWHTVYYGSAGERMSAGAVATTDDGYRLWFSTSAGLYYTDLSAELHNPLQNPTAEFKEKGYVDTPWIDMGWAEMQKLALYVEVQTIHCSPTETITLKVQYDDDESEWKTLGTITTNGLRVLSIADEGLLFKNARLRIEMERDPTQPGVTPILKSANFVFMRRPEQVWGFEVILDLSGFEHWEGNTPDDLLERLKEIADTKTAGRFIYRDDEDETRKEGRVVFSRLVGAEAGGLKKHGKYTVALVEIREPLDDVRV